MDSLSRDASVRIERYNAGREPERLALKYRAMCKSPFAFFRGTAHLFWEDVAARRPALPHGPLVWASGDLHFENFGSFQGDNGLSYFDLNDFDEGALAPATWEVARFVASAYVAAPSLDLTRAKITELVESFLDAYQTALGDGKARWVERATATGMVRTLLRRVSKQTRAMLLNSRTTMKKGKRRILIDGRRTLPITESRRTNVTRQLDTFAKSQPDPDFFKVLDVARRVAAIQQRMQAIAPALLHAKKIGRGGYVLHELRPTTDRLTLDDARGDHCHLRSAAKAMGHVTAWDQLRSSGRQGSATADDLVAFAGASGWKQRLIDFGRWYESQVQRDYERFVDAQKGRE